MCRFCEQFELSVECAVHSEFETTYSAAFLDHVIIDGKMRSRTIHYMKNGVGFPLNFCPECGERLLLED